MTKYVDLPTEDLCIQQIRSPDDSDKSVINSYLLSKCIWYLSQCGIKFIVHDFLRKVLEYNTHIKIWKIALFHWKYEISHATFQLAKTAWKSFKNNNMDRMRNSPSNKENNIHVKPCQIYAMSRYDAPNKWLDFFDPDVWNLIWYLLKYICQKCSQV